MQTKTTGIVLHTLKYSDSATIVTIYTQQFGRVSYIAYGANKKKSICRSALLQPLSIVKLDVIHAPTKEIQRIKELHTAVPFAEIPFNPAKNAIALFLSELLFRTLRRSESDENLYRFLDKSIQLLDCCERGIANFHLVFLAKFTRYLGCEPNVEKEKNTYFDLMNGIFLHQKPLHTHYLLPEMAENMANLLKTDYNTMDKLVFSRRERFELLESLVEYYRLHIPDFSGLHSLEVLQSLFD